MSGKQRTLQWVILLTTLVLGIAYSYYLGDEFRYFDEEEYFTLAKNLAEKGIYSLNGTDPTAWRPPGYPTIMAAVLYLGGGVIQLRILNFLAFTLSLWILGRWGLAGILLALCYPVLFYTAGTLYPQTIGTTLFLGSLWLFFNLENAVQRGKGLQDSDSQGKPTDCHITNSVRGDRSVLPCGSEDCGDLPRSTAFSRFNTERVILVGTLLGVLILTIPTFIFTLFFMALWRWRLSLVLCALLVIAPWSIRNTATFGHFVFVSTNGGVNLLIGNSKNTHPDLGVGIDLGIPEGKRFENEIEADRYYRNTALKHMWDHKWESVKMYVSKFINYFDYWNELATPSQESTLKRSVMFVTYYFLLILALTRLFVGPALGKQDLFCYLLYILNGAFAALFFTRIRFRLPFDVLLILINANFLEYFRRSR